VPDKILDIRIRRATPVEPGCWACNTRQHTNTVELHHMKDRFVRQFGMCDIHLFDLKKEIDNFLSQAYEPKNFAIPPQGDTSLS
jgi:hypothetical protein